MVVHCLSITTLTCPATDVLFELFKAGFNFPTRAIILDDLCHGKLQVSGEHCYPLCLTEHPNDPNRTFECFQHDYSVISANIPVLTVKVDGIGLGLLPNLGGHNGHRPQTCAVLMATSSLSRLQHIRLCIHYVIATQAG